METPKTPAELLALQPNREEETFVGTVETALADFEPSAEEALEVVVRLVRGLKSITYSYTEQTEGYLKKQWQEDYKKASKALDLLKAMDL